MCTPSVWSLHLGEHKTRLPAQPSTLLACDLLCYLTTRNPTFNFLLIDTRAFHVMLRYQLLLRSLVPFCAYDLVILLVV
jgi:hypothetical protein